MVYFRRCWNVLEYSGFVDSVYVCANKTVFSYCMFNFDFLKWNLLDAKPLTACLGYTDIHVTTMSRTQTWSGCITSTHWIFKGNK